jgi:hypothetical protein
MRNIKIHSPKTPPQFASDGSDGEPQIPPITRDIAPEGFNV